jgi:hypothetical protein
MGAKGKSYRWTEAQVAKLDEQVKDDGVICADPDRGSATLKKQSSRYQASCFTARVREHLRTAFRLR